jgi:NADPH2:quinone reductase
MATQLGARVIGTTSTPQKAALATEAGAAHVINYATDDFETEVGRITEGRGVDVVYDSVGAATFDKSLASLRPRGMMVSFGNASGPVPPVSPLTLSQRGSLFLTRPSLAHYMVGRDELLWRAGDVLGSVASGSLHVRIGGTYALGEAPSAHRDLEGRASSGKLILLPS